MLLLQWIGELSKLSENVIVESWYQLCFFKNFLFVVLQLHMGNKNPFVIETEFCIKQPPQQFLLKLMNMRF